MINLEYTEHKVIAVNVINDDLFELVVGREGLAFTPGDCLAIYTDEDKSRPYSIASGSEEASLRFVIREMDGGEVSPWLRARVPGEVIRITPPFGWFRPGQDIDEAPFIFIATGTGVAPFLSHARTFPQQPAHCLYGVRRAADAHGLEELTRHGPTTLAVSREVTEHHHGRVTDLLDRLPLEPETHFYCCGLESMVNEVSAWLRARGVELSRIHREVFFHG